MTRILLVEDEDSFSDPLSYLLGQEGYEVTVADDGLKALAEFDRNGADLVLLDLMLPGASGTEVCRELRAKSNVPIIMRTAKDSEIDKVVGLELGADDYVTKPFSLGEVLARLRAIERRTGRTGESGVVRTADGRVVVDLAAHLLEVEGAPVHLTPIEWKMLEVFVKHKGALVEAQTLLTEVWGPEFGKERNYLRVYMSQLRSKLEADPARPQYLHTQMGIGYRFTP